MKKFIEFDLIQDEQHIIAFLDNYEPFYYATNLDLYDFTVLTVDTLYELCSYANVNEIIFKWYGGAEEIAMEMIIDGNSYNLYQLTSLLSKRIQ